MIDVEAVDGGDQSFAPPRFCISSHLIDYATRL